MKRATQPAKAKDTILIERGRLSWPASERRSDRYGSVTLYRDNQPIRLQSHGMDRRLGRLVCVVIETRQSQHIGDLARGIFPSTPRIGDRIVLGTGRLWVDDPQEPHELSEHERKDAACMESLGREIGATVTERTTGYIPCIGLAPDDGRETDWLDPHKLYRVHDQDVELQFELLE